MQQGFFSQQLASKPQVPLLPSCGKCGLYRNCKSPKMPVYGKGLRKILVAGQSPGSTEDSQGRPFVGQSGQLLRESLEKAGVDLDRDCWTTNALRCRPWTTSQSGNVVNRTPTAAEVGYCRPYLIQAIKELQPEMIIPLGTEAVKSLIGWLWKDNVGAVSRWDGWCIPNQRLNSWISPTWHPSYIMRMDGEYQPEMDGGSRNNQENDVRKLLFERHLAAACKLKGRPWPDGPPDYKKRLRLILDPKEAAKHIRRFIARNILMAWDIETDRLKPDHKDAQIVCCSISDGDVSVAFPWHGEAMRAMREFIRSPLPKIGYNARFESRWVMKEFGCRVRNWVWDGMLAAHTLDNRSDITSLEFQQFVLLGAESHKGMKEYFEAKDSNSPNRIKEVGLPRLLEYCALDSLIEYQVAQVQAKRLGVKL